MKWLFYSLLLLQYSTSRASLKCVDLLKVNTIKSISQDIPFKDSHKIFEPVPGQYNNFGAEVDYQTTKVSGSGIILGVKWNGVLRVFDFSKQQIVEVNAASIPRYESPGKLSFITNGRNGKKFTQQSPILEILESIKPGFEIVAFLGSRKETFVHGNIEAVSGSSVFIKDPVTGKVSIFDLSLFKKFEIIILEDLKTSTLLKVPEALRPEIEIFDAFKNEREKLIALWDGRSNIYQESFYLEFFLNNQVYAKKIFNKWYVNNPVIKEVSQQLGWPLSTIFLDPAVGFHLGAFKLFINELSLDQLQNHTPSTLRVAFSNHLGHVNLFRAQIESSNDPKSEITSPLFFHDRQAQEKRVNDLLFPVLSELIFTPTPREDAARKLYNQDSTYISAATPEHVETAKIATTWFTGEGANRLLSTPDFSLFLYELTVPKLYTINANQVAARSKWPQYITNQKSHKINLEADGVEVLIPFLVPASWIVKRSETTIPEEYKRLQ